MEDYEPRPRYYNVNKQPTIGVSVSLVNTLLDCNDQITIGDYVSFGHDCMVLTGLHDKFLKGSGRQNSSPTLPVYIKKGAWIASRVVICPGSIIGENAVICAGAVVTCDVPDNEMWGGVPAKFIKNI